MSTPFNRDDKGKFYKDSNIISVFHGTDVFLLEDELNESQWNQIEARAEMLRIQYTSGIINNFNVVKVNNELSYIETLDGEPFSVLVDGYLVKIGGNMPSNSLSSDNRILFSTTPLNGIDENNAIHILEFWFESINGTQELRKYGGEDTRIITNSMIDSRIGIETSRRIQLRWKVSYNNMTELHLEEGINNGWTNVGNHLYRKNYSPLRDNDGNLIELGVKYAIVFAKGSHVTEGNPVIHENSKVKLKDNSLYRDMVSSENITLSDVNNLFESLKLDDGLDELKVQIDNVDLNEKSLVMDSIHSGFVKLGKASENIIENEWNVQKNKFKIEESIAYVNGHRIVIPETKIKISKPPVIGHREDLVFLETFLTMKRPGDPIYENNGVQNDIVRYAKTYEKVMEWRIRIVDDVDFNKYEEGIPVKYADGYDDKRTNVLPQGGNINPIEDQKDMTYYTNFSKANDTQTIEYKDHINKDDVGLYIAGNGNYYSKNILKTFDGYVYAIPMFKIKRRNSSGYSFDNPNGSSVVTSPVLSGSRLRTGFDKIVQLNLSNEEFEVIKKSVNKNLVLMPYELNGIESRVKILSAHEEDNAIIIENNHKMNSIEDDWVIECDRPDNKFADVIYEDDLFDLRHKVSLTGYNYQSLLEENFDKLLKGELQTKEKTIMQKERINLQPAMPEHETKLRPVKVKLENNTTKELVNLMSSFSNNKDCELFWVKHSDSNNWNKAKWSLDNETFIFKYNDSLVSQPIKINKNSYYLLSYKSSRNHPNAIDAWSQDRDIYFFYEEKDNYNEDFEFHYKVFYSWDCDNLGIGVYHWSNRESHLKDICLYEIDENTHDLITNRTPGYSGNELEKKFPYVQNYPEIAENLLTDIYNKNWNYKIDFEFDDGKIVVPPVPNDTFIGYVKFYVEPYTTYIFEYDCSDTDAIYPMVYYYSLDGPQEDELSSNGNKIVFSSLNSNQMSIDFFTKYDNVSVSMGNFKVSKLYNYIEQYVPYGRWIAPQDVVDNSVNLKTELRNYRKVVSDSQVFETVEEVITPFGSLDSSIQNISNKHILLNQGTHGIWSVGDTIEIQLENGYITGVSDDKVKILTNSGGYLNEVTLDEVTDLRKGGTFKIWNTTTNEISGNIYTITNINYDYKTITFSPQAYINNDDIRFAIPDFVNSVIPLVKSASYLVGYWSGLGTQEATFTITTPPTPNTSNIEIQYCVNYSNGYGIKDVPSEILEPVVNGIKYKKDNLLTLTADFRGKVKGSITENPHYTAECYDYSTIVSPIDTEWVEYDGHFIQYLNSLSRSIYSNESGKIVQQLFAFNVVEEVQRQLGKIPRDTDEGILEWMLSKIEGIYCTWFGYGESPIGYEANLGFYTNSDSLDSIVSHNSSKTNGITSGTTNIRNFYINNGYIFFVACVRTPSNENQISALHTDYVSLDIKLKVGEKDYDVFVPEKSDRILVDDPSMFKEGENMINPKSIFASNVVEKTTRYVTIGQDEYYSNSNIVNNYDYTVNILEDSKNKGFSIKYYSEPGKYYTLSFELDLLTSSSVRIGVYKDNGIYDYQSYSTNGLVSRTVNVPLSGEVIFTIESETNQGSFKTKNLMLTPGLNLKPFTTFSKDVKRKQFFDFTNKISGSVFENPHKNLYDSSSALPDFKDFKKESDTKWYEELSVLDGKLSSSETYDANHKPYEIFVFDLSHLGLSLKELKRVIRRIRIRCNMYGSRVNEDYSSQYGCQLLVLQNGYWTDFGLRHNINSLQFLTGEITANESSGLITDDQKIAILVTPLLPSLGGDKPSRLRLDYVSLEVELADWVDTVKKNVIKVKKNVKEVKLEYNPTSILTGRTDNIELFYNYSPYQGLLKNDIDGIKIKYMDSNFMYNTTLGTGYNGKIGSGVETVNLPLPINSQNYSTVKQDYEIIPVKQENELLSIESHKVRFKLNNSWYNIPLYQSSLNRQIWIILNKEMTTNRGYLSNNNLYYAALITDPLLDSSILYHPVCVEINNQLFILVQAYDGKNNYVRHLNAVIDLFAIDGRPLLKGDN